MSGIDTAWYRARCNELVTGKGDVLDLGAVYDALDGARAELADERGHTSRVADALADAGVEFSSEPVDGVVAIANQLADSRARVTALEKATREVLLSVTWGRGRTCWEEEPTGAEVSVWVYGGTKSAGVKAFVDARDLLRPGSSMPVDVYAPVIVSESVASKPEAAALLAVDHVEAKGTRVISCTCLETTLTCPVHGDDVGAGGVT